MASALQVGANCAWALVVLLTCAGVFVGANGDDSPSHFLASKWEQIAEEIVSDALASGFNGDRASFIARRVALEKRLKPLFRALPKIENGRLAPETVRYALHRHFVRQYSTYVHGLEPVGGVWNTSSPLDALSRRIPEQVRSLFDSRFGTEGGFNLRELALFGATLEFQIHNVALGYLREAYAITGHNLTTDLLNDTEVEDVMDACMKLYSTHSHQTMEYRTSISAADMPAWVDIVTFVRQKHREVLGYSNIQKSFPEVAKLVDVIIEGLGPQQQDDCNRFVDDLIKIEVPGSGRVKLSNFYATRFLDEDPEFLRSLGALDFEEHAGTPTEPHVIISNYVASKTNCIASTDLNGICCPDACEPLLTRLEEHFVNPVAKAENIISFVQAMPSRTQLAPRKLGEALVRRLSDIAEVHGGKVPLHGRLFAQWMHLAYPYECQLPMKLGTTMLTASKDVQRLSTERERYNSEKAQAYLQDYARAKDLEGGDLASTVLWHTEEVAFQHSPSSMMHQAGVLARAFAFCATFFVIAHLVSGSVAPSTFKTSNGAPWSI